MFNLSLRYLFLILPFPPPSFCTIKALVNVRGTVACKEKCGASVSVTLVSLAGKRNEERTVSLTDKSSEFLFQNVIPGKYRFEVHFLSSAHNIVFN